MFCRMCGKVIDDGSRFCGYCGTSVEENGIETEKSVSGEEMLNTAVLNEQNSELKADNRKAFIKWKPDKRGTIIVLSAVALTLAVSMGIFLYFSSDAYNCKRDMRLGKKYYEEEQYKEALYYYSAALDLDKSLIEAYMAIADIDMKDGKYREALEKVQEGIEETDSELLKEKHLEIYVSQAEIFRVSGDYAAALVLLNEAVQVTGNSIFIEMKAEVYQSQAEALLAEGEFLSALQKLIEGIKDTESDILKKQEAKLRECIVPIRVLGYVNDTLFGEGEYDSSGKMIKEIGYDYLGDIVSRTEYAYDASGNLEKETMYYGDGDMVGEWTEYRYEDGYLVEATRHFSGDGSWTQYRYEYDSEGYLTAETYCGWDGTVLWRRAYEYDVAGNLAKVSEVSRGMQGDDNVTECKYEYNTNGEAIKKIWSYGDWSEYEYDFMGNLVRENEYGSDGNLSSKTEYKYEYTYIANMDIEEEETVKDTEEEENIRNAEEGPAETLPSPEVCQSDFIEIADMITPSGNYELSYRWQKLEEILGNELYAYNVWVALCDFFGYYPIITEHEGEPVKYYNCDTWYAVDIDGEAIYIVIADSKLYLGDPNSDREREPMVLSNTEMLEREEMYIEMAESAEDNSMEDLYDIPAVEFFANYYIEDMPSDFDYTAYDTIWQEVYKIVGDQGKAYMLYLWGQESYTKQVSQIRLYNGNVLKHYDCDEEIFLTIDGYAFQFVFTENRMYVRLADREWDPANRNDIFGTVQTGLSQNSNSEQNSNSDPYEKTISEMADKAIAVYTWDGQERELWDAIKDTVPPVGVGGGMIKKHGEPGEDCQKLQYAVEQLGMSFVTGAGEWEYAGSYKITDAKGYFVLCFGLRYNIFFDGDTIYVFEEEVF